MTVKGFHEAAPIVKELAFQEALLFRVGFGDLRIKIEAHETKTLPALSESIERYHADDAKKVMAEIKKCIEAKIKRLNKEIEAIK